MNSLISILRIQHIKLLSKVWQLPSLFIIGISLILQKQNKAIFKAYQASKLFLQGVNHFDPLKAKIAPISRKCTVKKMDVLLALNHWNIKIKIQNLDINYSGISVFDQKIQAKNASKFE